MWVSPHFFQLTIFFSGQVASFFGFLTRDPSLIWNSVSAVFDILIYPRCKQIKL